MTIATKSIKTKWQKVARIPSYVPQQPLVAWYQFRRNQPIEPSALSFNAARTRIIVVPIVRSNLWEMYNLAKALERMGEIRIERGAKSAPSFSSWTVPEIEGVACSSARDVV